LVSERVSAGSCVEPPNFCPEYDLEPERIAKPCSGVLSGNLLVNPDNSEVNLGTQVGVEQERTVLGSYAEANTSIM
jgi:hypothetical protein